MKRVYLLSATLAFAFFIVASQSAGAQVMAGNYRTVSVNNAAVRNAAKFAIKEKSKTEKIRLIKITEAQRQVVAGMNYQLSLTVRSGTRIRHAKVVVWNKIDHTSELTSWDWRIPR